MKKLTAAAVKLIAEGQNRVKPSETFNATANTISNRPAPTKIIQAIALHLHNTPSSCEAPVNCNRGAGNIPPALARQKDNRGSNVVRAPIRAQGSIAPLFVGSRAVSRVHVRIRRSGMD